MTYGSGLIAQLENLEGRTYLSSTVLSFNATHPVTFIDATGDSVKISMAGSGSGKVTLSKATSVDASRIDIVGTTGTSTVTIATAGTTSVGTLTTNRLIKSITAASTTLKTSAVLSGAVGTLSLLKVNSGASIAGISIGTLNVTDDFAAAMKMNNASKAANTVVAATLGSLSGSKWNIVGNIGSLTVVGTALNSSIRATGTINTVIFGASVGTDVLAGVSTKVARHPAAENDFVNPAARINAYTIRGLKGSTARFFKNSNIAAPAIGNVKLLNMDRRNSGVGFGVYALHRAGNVGAAQVSFVKVQDTVSGQVQSYPPAKGKVFAMPDFTVGSIATTAPVIGSATGRQQPSLGVDYAADALDATNGNGQTGWLNVYEGRSVALNAVVTSSNGSVTYHWTQLSGNAVTIVNANNATAGFVVPLATDLAHALMQFQVAVTGADGLVSSAVVTVRQRLLGDINRDDVVNGAPGGKDRLSLQSALVMDKTLERYDLNNDGTLDLQDVVVIAGQNGRSLT